MASSHFASRHRKDLSTDMIRTKIARRKSLSQKENRHKEYERNRHIGLKDSNIPILQGRILAPLEETSQELAPEKASAKPRSTKTVLNDQRKKMLHKYKEEKQLQKLKEQREKAKRGVFKVGLYRPDMPGFLLSHSKPTTVKPDPNQAISSVRITRSRAKEQMDQTKVNNGRTIQTIQPSQRPTSEKKVPDKEKKAVKLVAPTAVRITRSATQATNQIPKTASSTTTRRPVSRATNGNELERKLPIKGRPVKNTEPNPDKFEPSTEIFPVTAKDLIRTTVGQTRLLMKERFKQFEGLVNDCEYKRGEKETTCTDLDGFWDMVSFQIDDVNQKFNNLSKLEESNWQHNSNTSKKTVRKKGVSNTTNKPKQDGGGRIAARNRLAAIKNAMRQRMKQEEQAEAADSVVPTTVDTIVFDAGFFRIESPVKSFSANKINFEMDCLPCDRMNISLLAVEVTNNTENIEGISEVVEGMELNSSIVEEDVLMSSSDKQLPSPSNISQQDETKVSLGQSVLIDGKSITVECHLLDSPGLKGSNPLTQRERRHREPARHISFGGNLIAFSPLRPLCGEQPEEC
ncbi:disks large-associated protein 5 [Echinops telfairi]|uniref:Disks large-associated protein 5 n=1 Tax=Echinops telfairi TaxID=9371 RepID=A0ABM0ZPF6_ECHTE|nr:disks large-associated protein 5 [Echinops telfairi]